MPLNDGTEYPVTVEQCQEWAGLYPAVDVIQQLRAMRGWLDANPSRRKTKSGIKRFAVNWLSKEQNRPRQASAVEISCMDKSRPLSPEEESYRNKVLEMRKHMKKTAEGDSDGH